MRSPTRIALAWLLTPALALTVAAAAEPTEAPTAPAHAPAIVPAQAAPEPDQARIDAWLAAGRALKAERPELFGGAEGVLAYLVLPDGQGAGAGIAPGDVLVAYGDSPLDSAERLVALTGQTPSTETLSLHWLRPGPGGAAGVHQADIRGGRIGVGIRDLADTPAARMQVLNAAGWAARKRGRYGDAMGLFRQGLTLAKGVGDAVWRGRFLRSIGDVLDDTGRYPEALEHHRQALGLARETADRWGEGAAHNSLGIVYRNLGRYPDALQEHTEALAIRRELGDRAEEGTALGNLGNVYNSLGRYPEALEHHNHALAIHRETGDRAGEGRDITSLGNVYDSLGRYPKALEHYAEALVIDREIGDRAGEGTDLGNLGLVYRSLGHYQEALQHHTQALAIDREIGDRAGEGRDLTNLGVVYWSLGRYPEALGHHTQALAIFREIGNRAGEGDALINLGAVYQSLGRYSESLAHLTQALRLHRGIGDRAGEGNILGGLGNVYHSLGRYPDALEHHTQALAIAGEIGNLAGESKVLLNLGALHTVQGHTAEALSHYQQALALQAELAEPELIWRLWDNLRRHWKDIDQPAPAILAGKRAVNQIQSMRATNASLAREQQQSFMEDNESVYRALADLLIAQGRIPEAEQVLAMLKEEELYDFIRRDAARDVKQTRADYTPAEAEWNARYARFESDLAALGREYRTLKGIAESVLTQPEKERLAEVNRRIKSGQQAVTALIAALEQQFKGQSPADATRLAEQALKDLRIQQARLREMGHGAVILSTVMGKDRLHIILTTPEVQLARQSPIGYEDLSRLVGRLRAALVDPASDPSEAARTLYSHLIAPVAKDLEQAQAQTLMLSLDGPLRYVPPAALYDGERWLVERYSLALYNKAAAATLSQQRAERWQVAGLGVSEAHPPFRELRAVPAELEGIVKRDDQDPDGVIRGQVHLNGAFDAARLVAVLEAKDDYPVLHIASHFALNPGNNLDSFLLLGDGSHLSIADIDADPDYALSGIDLLALSACDTAVSAQAAAGAEIESFGALAQLRGARGILATLWSVDDASTGALMQSLYGRRARDQSLTKAEALRQAQRALLTGEIGGPADAAGADQPCGRSRRPLSLSGVPPEPNPRGPAEACRWTHPYYWAPFVLMGNWL